MNIKKQILDINKSDDFFKKLHKIYYQEKDNLEIFYQAIVSLYNGGKINFTEEILNISNPDHDFFNTKIIFEKILPDLNISIQESMDCVKHIFQISGNDMSARMVFSSFVEYCQKDENRVKEALQTINNDTSWCNFIPSIIRAGSEFNLDRYVEISIEFTKHNDINVCKEALYSLGRLQYKNHSTSLEKSFQVIKNFIETTNDSGILSISIEAIFTLSTFDNALEDDAIHLIKIALKNSDDSVLYSASNLCFYQKEKLPMKLFVVLLCALENVNYEHTQTINNIDYGLRYLLENNQDMVVTYLEKVLMKNKELSITSFDSLLRDLHQKHNTLLNQCITKWFITGNINLCKTVMDIVGFFHDNKMILSADISQLEVRDNITHLFVIRKTIGWLFHHQISAVRFIISIIEILDKDNIMTVEDLLFDPFLISYSGSIKDYLKSIEKPKNKTKKVISNLLQRLENYHNDLDSAWNIKDLKPSQEQRESYFRLHNQQISDAMQESKKDSVFLSLVNEFTVLYGRRSVFYHPELGENPKDIRQEMNFQKIEHSVEYPILDFIDPHGLGYMLWVFKSEQFIK
ncbi:hypothetical protein [uncultured Gammaproteobacteria bacterium]|nr:hypothetical protein [uncultured Gammaproteobacteria bacterium]